MAAEELIKKGRKVAAAYLKAQCLNAGNPALLSELLDIFLDPEKKLSDKESIEWIEWLIAGGKSPDDFSQTVQTYDNATTCGLVWTASFVAYRCRTCGISPCMSLCAECFQKGNHDGHDFNMFRSQAGGACDCGDTSVMKETGFCPKHGPNVKSVKPPIPDGLTCMAEAIMPRIILRLIQHFRDNWKNDEDEIIKLTTPYIDMLQRLLRMGTAMRMVMTKTLIDPETYKIADKQGYDIISQGAESAGAKNQKAYFKKSYLSYTEAKSKLESCKSPIEDLKSFDPNLQHSTFLEELVFWMIKIEFPQDLVCFLLNLLLEQEYKDAFTKTFVHHYSRISVMLAKSTNSETLSHRVVHVSVQLFSNEELALRMTKKGHLLHIMVISLKEMISKILQQSSLQDSSSNLHLVVDCAQQIMKEHSYWPLVSDLNNVLTHRCVAHEFLNNYDILNMWFSLISMFQAMNVNHRELSQHLEFEPNSYYAAFSAELEASATPMWALLNHLQTPDTFFMTEIVLDICLSNLKDWFESLNFNDNEKPNPYQVTFHLPLHRYFAMFVCQAILKQGGRLKSLLPKAYILRMLVLHPLQTLAVFHEILNGLWVRNGVQIKGQALTYIQCHFCNSMVDADLFILQLGAMKLCSDWFLLTLFERFHVLEWFSFVTPRINTFLESDHVMPMLEGSLMLISQICSFQNNLGIAEQEITKREMVSPLCMMDRTHSQLMDILPEKCGAVSLNKDFEVILQQIADYKAPNFEVSGNMVQGTYMPKPHVWENEFDPIHVSLRAVHRRDYQAALDRYTQYVKKSGKYKGKRPLWPPYRIPGPIHPEFDDPRTILLSRTMQSIIFIILYRAVNEPEVSDQVLALTIHLLDIAVRFQTKPVLKREPPKEEVLDLQFNEWFPNAGLLDNIFVEIKKVLVPVNVAMEIVDNLMQGIESNEEAQVSEYDFEAEPVSLSPPLVPGLISDTFDEITINEASGSEMSLGYNQLMDGGQYLGNMYVVASQEETVFTMPSQSNTVHEINESIVSLLLKLHSKLSGHPDSYSTKPLLEPEESRIGDGPYFIGLLLDRIAALKGEVAIENVRQKIWPSSVQDLAKKRVDKEQKLKQVKDRQKKLIEEFAVKQKEFMKKVMETDDPDQTQESEGTFQEYECVICNHPSSSTPESLIGMVVLMQATSVLGHAHSKEEAQTLPCSIDELLNSDLLSDTRTAEEMEAVDKMNSIFDESSWQKGVNIGWQGGVHVQSCGHYLHLECLKSYIKTLQSQMARQQTLAVDKGEYFCPLCRQMANSVLPIHPTFCELKEPSTTEREMDLRSRCISILKLKQDNQEKDPAVLSQVESFLDDVMNTTFIKYRSYLPEPTRYSLLLFYTSLARTNLEIDLLQKSLKKSCFLPLFSMISIKTKLMSPTDTLPTLWSYLTGIEVSSDDLQNQLFQGVSPDREMPLLLEDPIALLILIVCLLPGIPDKSLFSCVVQIVYNLVVVKSLAQFSEQNSTDSSLHDASIQVVLNSIKKKLESSSEKSVKTLRELESYVRSHCLPFLKISSLLQSHLYSEPCIITKAEDEELANSLACHLELRDIQTNFGLSWAALNPIQLVSTWCTQFQTFVQSSPSTAFKLLRNFKPWHIPQLLKLPNNYDQIFQFYHKKACSFCDKVPKEPAVCLLCGTLVCLRDTCCRQDARYEALAHSISCGAGTAMFQVVNSSTIIVIRGKRACLWGSVYLDSYGEEDRDLKRGKPLFLSKERYQLLHQQWLNHRFDHTSKRWVWHKENL